MSNVVAIDQPQRDTGLVKIERLDHKLQLKPEDVETLRQTYGKELNESEFRLFVAVAQERGLNPLNRQIHAIVRGKKEKGTRTLTFQTSIDAFRLIAERSGKYAGQTPMEWCGQDGIWKDVWLENYPPAAARIGIFHTRFGAPLFGVAHYREYVQMVTFDGKTSPNTMWQKMPANQLAKCAEALALRKAFPEELSGIYTSDEMAQADNAEAPAERVYNPNAIEVQTVEEPTFSPEQRAVAERIDALDAQTRKEFASWYAEQNYPRVIELSNAAVKQVTRKLDELTTEKPEQKPEEEVEKPRKANAAEIAILLLELEHMGVAERDQLKLVGNYVGRTLADFAALDAGEIPLILDKLEAMSETSDSEEF